MEESHGDFLLYNNIKYNDISSISNKNSLMLGEFIKDDKSVIMNITKDVNEANYYNWNILTENL
jgi:hypothetical protein